MWEVEKIPTPVVYLPTKSPGTSDNLSISNSGLVTGKSVKPSDSPSNASQFTYLLLLSMCIFSLMQSSNSSKPRYIERKLTAAMVIDTIHGLDSANSNASVKDGVISTESNCPLFRWRCAALLALSLCTWYVNAANIRRPDKNIPACINDDPWRPVLSNSVLVVLRESRG